MAMAWIAWALTWATVTLVLVAASGAQMVQGSGVWGRQLGGDDVDNSTGVSPAKRKKASAPAAAAPSSAMVAQVA